MKISKTAATTARRLLGLCQTEGHLDGAKLQIAVKRLIEVKPRDYLGVLGALRRLVRIEADRRKATVESAVELDAASRERIAASLAAQYDTELSITYQTVPSLLGGLRIRVGDDVFDGSVKGRLDRFAGAIR